MRLFDARPAKIKLSILALFWISLVPACLAPLFEAPYLLATGLPPVRAIGLSARETLLAATDDGLWELSPQGDKAALAGGAWRAVSSHVRDLYAVDGQGQLHWGPPPAPGATWSPALAPLGEGWLDVLAWCDDAVLLARADQIWRWAPGEAAPTAWSGPLPGLRGLSLAPGEDCAAALAVSASTLWWVPARSGEPSTALIDGLTGLRAASRDGAGRIWVVAGDPPELSLLQQGTLQRIAGYLGDPQDLHFGAPPLLPPENLYLGNAAGSVDYVRLP